MALIIYNDKIDWLLLPIHNTYLVHSAHSAHSAHSDDMQLPPQRKVNPAPTITHFEKPKNFIHVKKIRPYKPVYKNHHRNHYRNHYRNHHG